MPLAGNPIFRLDELAEPIGPLTNAQIDALVHSQQGLLRHQRLLACQVRERGIVVWYEEVPGSIPVSRVLFGVSPSRVFRRAPEIARGRAHSPDLSPRQSFGN